MRKLFLLMIITAVSFSSCMYGNDDLYDSNVVVSGRVLDARTEKPISNAVVNANLIVASTLVSEKDAGTKIVRTDHKGRFTAIMNFDDRDLKAGGYYYINFTVTHQDYQEKRLSEWDSNVNILLEPK